MEGLPANLFNPETLDLTHAIILIYQLETRLPSISIEGSMSFVYAAEKVNTVYLKL